MIKKYLTFAKRHLLRNKLVSLINVISLALAISSCLVIFIFLKFERSIDQFHVNKNKIFLLTHEISQAGKTLEYGMIHAPLGEMLKNDFAEITELIRLENLNGIVQTRDKVFNERLTFTDASFFKAFSFTTKVGEIQAIERNSEVIISSRFSKKYFGEENPLGQTLFIKIGNRTLSFTVGGVLDELPSKSSVDFDLFINFQKLGSIAPEIETWNYFLSATFLLLKNESSISSIIAQQEKYVKLANAISPNWIITKIGFQPFSTLSEKTFKIIGDVGIGYGAPSGKIALVFVGVFILILSCFSFINILVASSIGRIKEIAVRKVNGAKRSDVAIQFMIETTLMVCLSMVIGTFLAQFILLPGFDSLFGFGLKFDYSNVLIWLFYLLLLIVIVLISGTYPSIYVSSFQPTEIFRSHIKFNTKNTLAKSLLALQFFLTFIAIVVGLLFIANENYTRDKDIGYSKDNIIVLKGLDERSYSLIEDKLLQNDKIITIAGTMDHIGSTLKEVSIVLEGNSEKTLKVKKYDVGPDYIEAMGLRVSYGRSFDSHIDYTKTAFLVNQSFVDLVGGQKILGTTISVGEERGIIVGVVENFIFNRLDEVSEPIILRYTLSEAYSFLVARAKDGFQKSVFETAEKLWKDTNPDIPYGGFFQEEVYQNSLFLMKGHTKVIIFITLLFIILSCSGLFGILSLKIIGKMKDYSIMKIMGATPYWLFKNIYSQFIIFLFVSITLGWPLSLFIVKKIFKIVYVTHIEITFIYPLVASIILILLFIMTSYIFIKRVINHNPIESIRNS